MNIELGIGIGGSSLASPTSNDRLVAYAWAMAGTPNVTTSTVINKTVTSVIANSIISALVPSISNAGNTVTSAVIANSITSAPVPIVAIAGSISINAVLASANSNGIAPVVSTTKSVSVSVIVADTIASACIPTVSIGGAASYYLQLDGVDDYIKTPSITITEVIIDFTPHITSNKNQTYVDARGGIANGYFTRLSNNADSYGIDVNKVYVDGVQMTNNTTTVQTNVRSTVRVVFNSVGTDDVNLFSNQSNLNPISADIYDVKFYNGVTLVAQYDMSTGTVQDQTGNGKHATLSGGTWVVA